VCLLLTFFCLAGCKSFIEVPLPDSQLSTAVVFEDKGSANAALTEIYSKIRDYGMLSGSSNGLSYILGMYTDELEFYDNTNNEAFSFYSNTILANNDVVKRYWNNAYNQIYAANAVYNGVEQSTNLSPADRNQLKGEALFIRALLHFYLSNLFGSIPYVTTTDYQANSRTGKVSKAEVYQKAKQDLTASLNLLTEKYLLDNRTRANAFTVHALMARIALYEGSWIEAETHASAVIAYTSLYGFDNAFDQTFLKTSGSTIFQFSPERDNFNTLEAITFSFESGPPTGAALRESFVQSFESGDLRASQWIRTVQNNTGRWYHSYKYKAIAESAGQTEFPKLFRLSEMYLIRSEANARQDKSDPAAEDLNAVRAQSGLPKTNAAGTSALLEAILQERKFEFFSESGHRFFDLLRFNRTDAVLGTIKPGWDSKDKLFPIPEAELKLNPNIQPQNTGY